MRLFTCVTLGGSFHLVSLGFTFIRIGAVVRTLWFNVGVSVRFLECGVRRTGSARQMVATVTFVAIILVGFW